MPSYSPNRGIPLPTVGDDDDQWGTLQNQGVGIIDSNLGGQASINVAGNSNVTANTSQAQNLIQSLSGVLTGNIEYILPPVGSFYIIVNGTTGDFTVTVTTVGGSSGVVVPQGTFMLVVTPSGQYAQAGAPQFPLPTPPTPPAMWQVIQTQIVEAVASVAFLLPSGFVRYRLTIQQTVVSTLGSNLQLQFSDNGGVSYINTGYAFVNLTNNSTPAVAPGSASGVGAIPLTSPLNTFGSFPTDPTDGVFDIFAGSTSPFQFQPVIRGSALYIGSAGGFSQVTISGTCGTAALMNAMEISISGGGVVTGTFILEGLPS